jgi:hypothetical protein
MPSANSKLYSKYKQLEKKAITLLLSRSSESYGNWSVARLELEAITVIPSLDYAKLISVAGYLEESLKLREITYHASHMLRWRTESDTHTGNSECDASSNTSTTASTNSSKKCKLL